MDMDHVANKRRETEEEVRTSPFDLAMTTANVFWQMHVFFMAPDSIGAYSLNACHWRLPPDVPLAPTP